MEHHPHHIPDHGPGDRDAEQRPHEEVPSEATALEQVSAHLRTAFETADARGEAIDREDALAVANLLAPLLGEDSEVASFAITGDADPASMLEECEHLKTSSGQADTSLWIEHLTRYLRTFTGAGEQPQPAPEATRSAEGDKIPIDGTPQEEASTYLRAAIETARDRGEAIDREDARALAALLAPLLDPGSEMARFARTGDAPPALLDGECERLRAGVGFWISAFKRHLAASVDLGLQPLPPAAAEPDQLPQTPPIEEGLRSYGDAFRAYLQLPDIDPHNDYMVEAFEDHYVAGGYASMGELIEATTEILPGMEAIKSAAERWGFEDLITIDQGKLEARVREVWNIIEVGGKFYVFGK